MPSGSQNIPNDETRQASVNHGKEGSSVVFTG